MFITKRNYENLLTRIGKLEKMTSGLDRNLNKTADRLHELTSVNNAMSLPVVDQNHEPIENKYGQLGVSKVLQKWVDMRDVVRSVADKVGLELVFVKGVEGKPQALTIHARVDDV